MTREIWANPFQECIKPPGSTCESETTEWLDHNHARMTWQWVGIPIMMRLNAKLSINIAISVSISSGSGKRVKPLSQTLNKYHHNDQAKTTANASAKHQIHINHRGAWKSLHTEFASNPSQNQTTTKLRTKRHHLTPSTRTPDTPDGARGSD